MPVRLRSLFLSALCTLAAVPLFAGCSFNDPIEQATERTLAAINVFEASRNGPAFAAYMTRYDGEATGTAKMMAFADWSIQNRSAFEDFCRQAGSSMNGMTVSYVYVLGEQGLDAVFLARYRTSNNEFLQAAISYMQDTEAPNQSVRTK